MIKLWRQLLAAGLKTHVSEYPGSPVEDQAIEPISAVPGNLLLDERRTGHLRKSIHQTSSQGCRALCCWACGHTLSPVSHRPIRTLQEFVHSMDDMDKEPVSNLCGHCGAFLLLKTHKPVRAQSYRHLRRSLARYLRCRHALCVQPSPGQLAARMLSSLSASKR
jgi:hypothetical protein